MKAHQERALEAGLSEFDRTVRQRRLVRGSMAIAAIMMALGTAVWLLASRESQRREMLPAYVELIHTPTQLGEQLALAEACERVGFEGRRMYLVDCTPRSNP